MLVQLLIAEMRDSQALAVASTRSFKRWEMWAGRKLPRALQCAERRNAALALFDEIIRRESVWWGTRCSASWTSVRVYSVLHSQQSFLLPWELDTIPSGGDNAL